VEQNTEMTVAAQKQIAVQALALPKKARERLAHQLWESLKPVDEKISRKEWTRVWSKELNRRMEEIRSGKVKAIPAAQVMAELRAKYG
jgi:putative addiction module component (TIGR02574 family)